MEHKHMSDLLRRILARWDTAMAEDRYEAAAYLANDIESCARSIINRTYSLHNEELARRDNPKPQTE